MTLIDLHDQNQGPSEKLTMTFNSRQRRLPSKDVSCIPCELLSSQLKMIPTIL